jgi:hypothetical protein
MSDKLTRYADSLCMLDRRLLFPLMLTMSVISVAIVNSDKVRRRTKNSRFQNILSSWLTS